MLLALFVFAAPMKIAVAPLQAGEGVTQATANALTEALTAEMRQRKVGSLITHDEIQSLLSLEEQKQAVGCTSNSCIAELGGALGVDHMLQGSVSKLGESWLLHVKLFDVRKSALKSSASLKAKGSAADTLLPLLPQAVSTLFGSEPSATSAVNTPPPANNAAVAQSAPPKEVAKDEPATDVPSDLLFFTDKKDRYFAYDTEGRRLFWGSSKALYEQRSDSSGRNGDKYYTSFWEPLYRDGTNRQVAIEGNTGKLACGASILLFEKTKAPANVKFFKRRWRRRATFLGLSETGTYVYVDESTDGGDYRLYTGKRGAMGNPIEADSADAKTFATDQGVLVWDRAADTATWQGGKIGVLDLYHQGEFIYTKLGVYAGQRRASPCESNPL